MQHHGKLPGKEVTARCQDGVESVSEIFSVDKNRITPACVKNGLPYRAAVLIENMIMLIQSQTDAWLL